MDWSQDFSCPYIIQRSDDRQVPPDPGRTLKSLRLLYTGRRKINGIYTAAGHIVKRISVAIAVD
jgi:hypothetical protein